MIVCHCRGVSDRAIRKAVRDGAADPMEVGRRCGAGTRCGGCLDTVREIVHLETAREQAAQPILLIPTPVT